MLTLPILLKIAQGATTAHANKFLPHLNAYAPQFGVISKLRMAGFLSQVVHESGYFRYVREIASGRAYEGRKDLGNTQRGDGIRFKGRGLIQVTGRANYTKMGKALGIDCVSHPELLEEPKFAVLSAYQFWYDKGLNRLADAGKIIEISKRVNGGTNGLSDRQAIYQRALKYL